MKVYFTRLRMTKMHASQCKAFGMLLSHKVVKASSISSRASKSGFFVVLLKMNLWDNALDSMWFFTLAPCSACVLRALRIHQKVPGECSRDVVFALQRFRVNAFSFLTPVS